MDRQNVFRHNLGATNLDRIIESDSLDTGGRDSGITQWNVAVDGIFIKQIQIPHQGTLLPQHTHTYDHHSMLAKGSVTVFVGDENLGEFVAPTPIFIRKGVRHSFISLEDDVIIYCIHNLHGQDEVDLIAEHT
jgi:mannose-6-phosphate isomerase-like protein (cupin superfamily)